MGSSSLRFHFNPPPFNHAQPPSSLASQLFHYSIWRKYEPVTITKPPVSGLLGARRFGQNTHPFPAPKFARVKELLCGLGRATLRDYDEFLNVKENMGTPLGVAVC